ncbi:MAG: class I SAM-dependent methyltransferase [Streptosporangiales bacterium]|nr:class I SAM-dependent methyltransferase [Streptosporangiales bacterium]
MPQIMTAAAERRWDELLEGIISLIPDGVPAVISCPSDDDAVTAISAERISEALSVAGVPCPRHAPPADGQRSEPVVIRLRTARSDRAEADIVIDAQDPGWPVIRKVSGPLAAGGKWYLAETRAFFACRAATWDVKFGDDIPSYAAAVAEAGIPAGGTVVDVGCGTGRAVPALRAAVGPSGTVVALDLTPEMLQEARPRCAAARDALVLADARRLPLAGSSADAVFAAGLVMHLPDPESGFAELARVTRPGGRLVLFHPSGRASLAARHGRALRPDEPLSEGPLRRATAAAGWELTAYDDAADRFLALATRR